MKYKEFSQHYSTDNAEYSTDAGCHRKMRPMFRITPEGHIVGGYWIELDDEAKKALYTDERNRNKEPVDPSIIVYAPSDHQLPDGRWATAVEIEQKTGAVSTPQARQAAAA